MNELHHAVYLRAREYWNTRFNDIHVPLAYLHGRQLLLAHPAADADVVIPAILLHDVGWKSIPEGEQGQAYGPLVEDEGLRRHHEIEGARIANEILSAINYDPRKQQMIAHIIDGHDSRLESLSEEDSVVKDADKIWRFTPVGVEYAHLQFGKSLKEYLAWLGCQIDCWFFTERGKQMAREAFFEIEHAVAEVGHV
ncbi:MAG: HD domain-containing protein [Proteobacteria bacterium]|nr:HD domain-containing protein [Pseudomonadota bacterium]